MDAQDFMEPLESAIDILRSTESTMTIAAGKQFSTAFNMPGKRILLTLESMCR